MVLNFGDCIILEGVYGLALTRKGNFKTIMVFEKHDQQLIATATTYVSKAKMESFTLVGEPSESELWCNSGLIDGSIVPLEWVHPADIADRMVPEDRIESAPKREPQVSADPAPVTPRRQRTAKASQTPSRGRKFNMTPKKLFKDSDESDEYSGGSSHSEDSDDSDFATTSAGPVPTTPRKRRAAAPKQASSRPTKVAKLGDSTSAKTPDLPPVTPRKKKTTRAVVTGDEIYSQRSLPISPHKARPETPRSKARNLLHVAFVPESLPCRTEQFSRLFYKLQEAIKNKTGTCIYVSGTPGTGKSSTIREVVEQLVVRKEDGELEEFDVLEINGMRLGHATLAYDALHDHLHAGERIGTKNAMSALERQFNDKKNKMNPLIVIMEELDQLLTKDQSVIYNFFNWPTLPSSRLIVIAVSNTLDMPERLLQNKIKSRLGLENIKFPGYNQGELREILNARLEDSDLVLDDAVEYVARKVGNVSGDARRALDICRRAVELAPDNEPVTLEHVLTAIKESQQTASTPILASLSLTSKILMMGLFQYSKQQIRESAYPAAGVLQHCKDYIKTSPQLSKFEHLLFGNNNVRMRGYQHAISELVEGGLIALEFTKGDSTGNIRLNIDMQTVENALQDDEIISIRS